HGPSARRGGARAAWIPRRDTNLRRPGAPRSGRGRAAGRGCGAPAGAAGRGGARGRGGGAMIRVERGTPGVPGTGLPVLRELVHERTGIFFDEHRTDLLAERLAPLILRRGFRSYLDLYYLLKYDEAASKAAWHEVFDALAVPETYFWREMDQVRAI